MKHLLCVLCAVSIAVASFAQRNLISVTINKTSSLIFPFSIKHVDRGSQDITVQDVKEANNILLVKAARQNFPETNLTVITNDDSVYDFTVDYEEAPALFVYKLPTQSSASISDYARGILDNPKSMNGPRAHAGEVSEKLSGIYIKDDIMYFQLKFYNQSPINYDIDFIRVYIRDKKKGKRTAVQENELKPLYVAGNISKIKANSSSAIVVALEKFTIPDAKYLAVQVLEKNGGRNLFLKISNKKIMKASTLPDLR